MGTWRRALESGDEELARLVLCGRVGDMVVYVIYKGVIYHFFNSMEKTKKQEIYIDNFLIFGIYYCILNY